MMVRNAQIVTTSGASNNAPERKALRKRTRREVAGEADDMTAERTARGTAGTHGRNESRGRSQEKVAHDAMYSAVISPGWITLFESPRSTRSRNSHEETELGFRMHPLAHARSYGSERANCCGNPAHLFLMALRRFPA